MTDRPDEPEPSRITQLPEHGSARRDKFLLGLVAAFAVAAASVASALITSTITTDNATRNNNATIRAFDKRSAREFTRQQTIGIYTQFTLTLNKAQQQLFTDIPSSTPYDAGSNRLADAQSQLDHLHQQQSQQIQTINILAPKAVHDAAITVFKTSFEYDHLVKDITNRTCGSGATCGNRLVALEVRLDKATEAFEQQARKATTSR